MEREQGSAKRQRLTAKRQQEILDAAVRVFSRKGFNGATTKEIAVEAGVAEGTIFRYFKTKKDILLSMVGPFVVQSLADTMQEVSGETDETVLTAIIKNRFDLIKKNQDLVRLLFTEAQFHPELREMFVEKVVLKASDIMEKFIMARMSGGAYKNIDPKITLRILVGMTGIFVLWKMFMFGDKYVSFDEDILVENIVDVFLNGIRKNTGGNAAEILGSMLF